MCFPFFIQSLSVSIFIGILKRVLLIEDLGERGTRKYLFHYKIQDAGECSFLARHSHSNLLKLLLWSYGPDLPTQSLEPSAVSPSLL